MKLPFGSRGPQIDGLDEFDEFDELDDLYDYDEGYDADDRPPPPVGAAGRHTVAPDVAVGDPEPEPDLDDYDARFDDFDQYDDDGDGLLEADHRDGRPRPPVGRRAAVTDPGTGGSRPHPPPQHQNHRVAGGTNVVAADEFADQMERLRSEASAEQRTAWAYLGTLSFLFLFLVGFGYGCSDRTERDIATGEMAEVMESGEPARLLFRVDGDIITLQGNVPSEAARGQLVTLAQNVYGSGNVIDELVIDGSATFDAGTIRTVGAAAFDDERSQQLHDSIGTDFGLADRGFEVGFVDTVLTPAAAQVAIDGDRVTLSGALPDQQSVDDLTGLASEIWGPANVDASAVTVGATTWTEGRIRLTGTQLSTDDRADRFAAAVPERIGLLVAVERAGLVTEDVTAILAAIQGQINQLLADNPIQFAPQSAEIEPASDQVLVDLAALLNQVEGNAVEIVGHTDSSGDEQENLLLSQDRAQAVLDRLVELGVTADRLTSRGEGEANPVADNSTADGRALNRRIEFVFVGTTDVLTTPTTNG